MRKLLYYTACLIITIIFLFPTLFSFIGVEKTYAEQYPCDSYSHQYECISFTVTSGCTGTSPYVKWDWTGSNTYGNSKFTVVYSRNGSWYIKDVGSTSWTMTTPPFGGPGSGGQDNTALHAGEIISGKLSGGYAPNITTGYTPDKQVQVKDCATPTNTPTPTPHPTPASSPTPTPTPGPIPTTGNLTVQIQGIGPTDNTNPLHPTRQIVLYFYPETDTTFHNTPYVAKGNVTFNQTTDFFSNASFPLTGLSAGKYLVLARTLQGSLVSQIGTGDGTGPITIVNTGGANLLVDTQDSSDTNADTTVPILSMGDFVTNCDSSSCDFNHVYTLDWSALVDCFGDKKSQTSCTNHGVFPNTQDPVTDINDDGVVDGIDYTILLGNFGHFGVGQQTMNRGNPPQ